VSEEDFYPHYLLLTTHYFFLLLSTQYKNTSLFTSFQIFCKMSGQISFDDFLKIDMRIGKILSAEDFPKAKKPAFKLTIDFGEEIGIKRSSAQITKLYTKEELIGTLIVAVVNFPPKQVADFVSEVLVLGSENENGDVVLLKPERGVKVGEKIK
jgi:tRNA-binding protein